MKSILCLFLTTFNTVGSFQNLNIWKCRMNRNNLLRSPPSTILFGELQRISQMISQCNSPADAMVLLNEAKALREQAIVMQSRLQEEKQMKLAKQQKKVDRLIDTLLFHGLNSDNDSDDVGSARAELLQTEEEVAQLFISKRLDEYTVNQMFDRIVEVSNRPQSTDNCSPLLSLLMDAANKVDCLEREENPNKRWNGKVGRRLRKKLFAMGYGIRLEDVEREERGARSISGDKDLF